MGQLDNHLEILEQLYQEFYYHQVGICIKDAARHPIMHWTAFHCLDNKDLASPKCH